jgi:hypothetical protein
MTTALDVPALGHSPVTESPPAAPTRTAHLAVALTAALVTLALVRYAVAPINWDASWLLTIATEQLHGARLYRDLLEINPPLIVWLLTPVAWLASITGLPIGPTFTAAVLVTGLASAWAAWRLLPSEDRSPALACAGLVALVVLPAAHFGQREHLVEAWFLPLLAVTVRRVRGLSVPRWGVWTAGLLVALAVSLKPFFLPAWLLLAAVAWRSTGRLPREHVIVTAAGVVYVAAVALLAPDFFRLVRTFGPIYATFATHPWAVVLDQSAPKLLAVVALAWLLIRRRDGVPILPSLTLLLAVGFLVGGAAQHRGWDYHYLPAYGVTFVAAALLAHRAPRWPLRLLLVGLCTVMVAPRAWDHLGAAVRSGRPDPERIALRQAGVAGARTVIVFSSTLTDAFPAVPEAGLRWVGSFPMPWTVQASYPTPASHAAFPHRPEAMSPGERAGWTVMARDLVTRRPDVLVVERPETNAQRLGVPGFDYLAYLAMDPVAAAALRPYRQIATTPTLAIYRRDTP